MSQLLSEVHVEQACLSWLASLGRSIAHGPDISPLDLRSPGTERASYRDVVLAHRLREAIARLNPHIPPGARDDALRRVVSPNVPGLVNANRQVHRWLVDGVPVEFQKDGGTRGDRVRLVDFADVAANDWLAVNQFSVQGPKLTRRPDEFLEDVRHMKERNLAVELLERLLKGEIKSRFKTNVVQSAKFSELLQQSLARYRNRAIETAQVIEELIAMARKFQEAALRGERMGLNHDEVAFYDALATNEAAVRELGDETLKKIAVELVTRLRGSVTVDWAKRDTVRAKLRVMVRTLLKRYKYPPDRQEEATETVLRQAESLSAQWVAA